MKRSRTLAAALAAVGIVTLVGCGPEATPSTPATTTATTTAPAPTTKPATNPPTTPPTTASTPEPTKPPAADPVEVPDVVGMNHKDAQDLLRSKGFLVNEESISPGNTFIINNSNWKVCRQDPAPGATDALRVAIYSVKLNESC